MGLLDLFSEAHREPAECVIKVDDNEITDLYPFLTEVDVDCSRRNGCEATLKFETVRDEQGIWVVQDEEILMPWKTIVIEAAFGSHTEEVMSGFIQTVDSDYPQQQGSATVTVRCRDNSLLLDREHVREIWGTEEQPVGDADILRDIVSGRHGLQLNSDNGDGQSDLVQQNQDGTDISFLRARAQANGYELIFEGDTVYFGPLRLDGEAQENIMVYAGRATNCIRFSTSFDGHQPDQVAFEVAATEGDQVEEEVVDPDLDLLGNTAADSSSAGIGDFVWRMSREGSRNIEELRAMAQRKANDFSLKIKGEGELDGTLYGHVLKVAYPVGVDGIGDWMGGVYYVDTVRHVFNTEGYKQTFKLLRNAYGDNL